MTFKGKGTGKGGEAMAVVGGRSGAWRRTGVLAEDQQAAYEWAREDDELKPEIPACRRQATSTMLNPFLVHPGVVFGMSLRGLHHH